MIKSIEDFGSGMQIAEGGMAGQEGVHPAFAWTTALCNDGTVWIYSQGHGWGKEPLPLIPQGNIL